MAAALEQRFFNFCHVAQNGLNRGLWVTSADLKSNSAVEVADVANLNWVLVPVLICMCKKLLVEEHPQGDYSIEQY